MSQQSTKFIKDNVVTNTKAAQLPANTIKGNNTGVTANASDLTVSQTQTMLGVPTTGSPLPINAGGTGQTTQQTAINALTGTQSSGKYLRSDGTNSTLVTIVAGDVPTLNQNTTGTAANITATSNSTLTTLSSLSLPYSQITGAPNVITALTGDGTASGPGSAALTLSTVNSNTGTFGSGSVVPIITVNGKGLITAVSTAAVVASAAYNTVSKTSAYSANINDYISASGSAFTITLPTAVGVSGQSIILKKTDSSLSNIITVNTTSAQTIDGLVSGVVTANTLNELYIFTSDGSNWSITEHKTITGLINAGTINVSATSAYVFTNTAANATAGAIYSNNSQTFIVTTTIAAGTTLTCAGTGAPLTSGTLTKVSGTGDATITFSSRTVTGVPAIAGGAASNNVSWYRQGKYAYISYKIEQTSGTAGSGNYVLYLPTGLTIDTSITPLVGSTGTYLGNVAGVTSGLIPSSGNNLIQGASYIISAFLWVAYSSNSMRLATVYSAPSSINWDASNFNFGSASTLFLNVTIVVPISGWQQ